MKNPLFDIYEVVTIKTARPKLKEIHGTSGVVLSQTADEMNKVWVYTVAVNELHGETWQVLEYELFSTGKKVDPKDVHTDEIVHIKGD